MNFISIIALFLLGSASFLEGCTGKVPAQVTANGVPVGGLSYAAAESLVREEIAKNLPPLVIHAPNGDYTVRYPELSFTDSLSVQLRKAKRGEQISVFYERTWVDAEERLLALCEENAKEAKNAELAFTNEGFTYTPEKEGLACGYEALKTEVFTALKGGICEVTVPTRSFLPPVTEETLRAGTRLLSSFETRFSAQNEPRSHNIALSSGKIGGTVVEAGKTFSFNETVGARTAENGYQEAAIIKGGTFQKGIGGGVCQTSTTLFNAALLAGMEIVESRPHSLRVSYVAPSLDAMVSSQSDFKFKNPYDFPVYLRAFVKDGRVKFEFYGRDDGTYYETESVTLMRLTPPAPKLIEGSENRVVREEKEGLASESYLLKYSKEGELLSRKRIRRDSYAAVQGIYEIAE